MNKHGEMVELDVHHASPHRTRAHKPIIWIAGGIPTLATVLAFLGPMHWTFDLLSHLRFQYAVILLILVFLCMFLRQPRPALVFLLPLVLNLLMIVPLYLHPGLGESGTLVAVRHQAEPPPLALTPLPDGGAAVPNTTPENAAAPAPPPAAPPANGAAAEVAADAKAESEPGSAFNPEPDRDRRLLRVLTFHLRDDLRDEQDMLNYIREHDADVVVFHNVSRPVLERVEFQIAPFRVIESAARPDGFGIAVAVRMMLRHQVKKNETRVLKLTDDPRQTPAIEATFTWHDVSLKLLAVNLQPPITSTLSALHRKEVAAVANWARQQQGLVLVAGQLNTTPSGATFQQLLKDSGLINSQRGFGIQASWPASGGPAGGIPINHLLHSPQLVTVARRLGPALSAEQSPLEVVMIRAPEYEAYRAEQRQKPLTLLPQTSAPATTH